MMKILPLKTILSFVFVVIMTICSFAQDVIVLNDASKIQAKVLEIGVNEITYKKWNFQDGPNYKVLKEDVSFVEFANGEKEVYNQTNDKQHNSETEPTRESQKKFKSHIPRTLFNTYIEVGCPFSAFEAGPSLNFTLGARFYDYGFAGLCVGSDALFVTYFSYWDAVNIPILLNLRGYYPVNENVYPFLDFSVGVNVIIGNVLYYNNYGYYNDIVIGPTGRIRVCAGVEYKRFTAALGYDFITSGYGSNVHLGYAKIGIKLGKLK
ncbi:MAG: hypothetical protein MJZ72_04530 [Bacteroidales bacterium]|nr:hypothetical protein [Bacteroidales bacterium]